MTKTNKAKDTPPLKKFYSYIEGVKNGEIKCCNYVKLAIDRFDKMSKSGKYEFRESEVFLVVSFFETLPITTGANTGKSLECQPWQAFILGNIFGWYHANSNNRVFTQVYVEVAKKNGKTPMAAVIVLYMNLIKGGNFQPECYFSANSRDQANIGYNEAVKMIDESYLKQYFQTYNSYIKCVRSKGIIQALSAEAKNTDGKKPKCSIVDEYHVHPNSEVYETQKSGMASHENPLLFTITTAGLSMNSVCKDLRDRLVTVLEGTNNLPSYFIMIYTIDADENGEYDFEDESNWIMSNPNLDVSVNRSFIRSQVEDALTSSSTKFFVLTKHFNIWQESLSTWIDKKYLNPKKLYNDLVKESLEKKKNGYSPTKVFLGIDLSTRSDLSAVSIYFPEINHYHTLVYCPEQTCKNRMNEVDYFKWAEIGHIKITEGNVIDHEYIIQDIIALREIFIIESIGFDVHNAVNVNVRLEYEEGFNMHQVIQGYKTLSPIVKQMEIEALSNKSSIEDNDCVIWAFSNVVLVSDAQGNLMPAKNKSKDKIDPVVSNLIAKCAYVYSDGSIDVDEIKSI